MSDEQNVETSGRLFPDAMDYKELRARHARLLDAAKAALIDLDKYDFDTDEESYHVREALRAAITESEQQ